MVLFLEPAESGNAYLLNNLKLELLSEGFIPCFLLAEVKLAMLLRPSNIVTYF